MTPLPRQVDARCPRPWWPGLDPGRDDRTDLKPRAQQSRRSKCTFRCRQKETKACRESNPSENRFGKRHLRPLRARKKENQDTKKSITTTTPFRGVRKKIHHICSPPCDRCTLPNKEDVFSLRMQSRAFFSFLINEKVTYLPNSVLGIKQRTSLHDDRGCVDVGLDGLVRENTGRHVSGSRSWRE